MTLKRLNDHDGADSSGGISSEDYHTPYEKKLYGTYMSKLYVKYRGHIIVKYMSHICILNVNEVEDI